MFIFFKFLAGKRKDTVREKQLVIFQQHKHKNDDFLKTLGVHIVCVTVMITFLLYTVHCTFVHLQVMQKFIPFGSR